MVFSNPISESLAQVIFMFAKLLKNPGQKSKKHHSKSKEQVSLGLGELMKRMIFLRFGSFVRLLANMTNTLFLENQSLKRNEEKRGFIWVEGKRCKKNVDLTILWILCKQQRDRRLEEPQDRSRRILQGKKLLNIHLMDFTLLEQISMAVLSWQSNKWKICMKFC